MRLFHDIPIKRKLMAMTTLASGIALAVACLAFVIYDQVGLRDRVVRDLSVTAAMTGANSTAGLTFNEPGSVEQSLKSLSVQPNILRGCVYTKEGQPFALYSRDGRGRRIAPRVQPDGHRFAGGQLELFQHIALAGEDIGTVYLAMDLQDMTRRVWRYTIIAGCVLLASTLVALFLSAQLQRVISEPLTDLAGIVTRVALEKDYSVRATYQGGDEVGRLIQGFNEMLSQIQQRDAALEGARANLEGRVEERTRELANSLSLLNATLESTADAILAVDHSGKVTCHNQNLVTLWALPPDLLRKSSYDELMSFIAAQISSPEQFLEAVREQRARPEGEFSHVVLLKDGRIFERHVRPQKIDHQCVGQVIILRDITERRQSEAKLEEVSRQAGMAEVATSVLHNVGNVLNSVNTSAALIKKNLGKSPAEDLAAVVERLAANKERLGAFLGEENRAMQLIAYLRRLDECLVRNRAGILDELEGLTRNIDHIKEIVAMQQNYARHAGVIEVQSLPLLMEDALHMYGGALDRHQVQTVRRYSEIPNIPLDKHKALQVLVNLVSNAKKAMSSPDVKERVLTMGICRRGVDHVCLSVSDTGVGIPPEHLRQIFNHGFTTRPDGHGFGLHSAALAAREMGGALLAQSEGVGRGATFVLELPLSPPPLKT